jgi:hypothetical protein
MGDDVFIVYSLLPELRRVGALHWYNGDDGAPVTRAWTTV